MVECRNRDAIAGSQVYLSLFEQTSRIPFAKKKKLKKRERNILIVNSFESFGNNLIGLTSSPAPLFTRNLLTQGNSMDLILHTADFAADNLAADKKMDETKRQYQNFHSGAVPKWMKNVDMDINWCDFVQNLKSAPYPWMARLLVLEVDH